MRRFEVHYLKQGSITDRVAQVSDLYKGVIEKGKIEFFAEDWDQAMFKADQRLEMIDYRFLIESWEGPKDGVLDEMEMTYYNRYYKDNENRFKVFLAGYFRLWVEPDPEV